MKTSTAFSAPALSLAAALMAVASLTAIAVPARAETAKAGTQVSFADLDFHQPADLATFNARVQAAAHSLCMAQGYTGTRVANPGPCIRAVVKDAFDQLDTAHRSDVALAGDKIVIKGLASR